MNRGPANLSVTSVTEVARQLPLQPDRRTAAAGRAAFPQIVTSPDAGISPQEWLDCWSNLDQRARMVITPERRYLAGDRRAEQALAARTDLRLNAMHVESVDPAGLPDLTALSRVEEGQVKTICLRRRRRGGHLLMQAVHLAQAQGRVLLGVSFWIANDSFVVEWPDFRPVFGLTAAEAKIVEQLIQGIAAEEIAAVLNVSINTVRTHISHVYEKLGITCREELWRRLAPYRLN